MGRGRRKPRTLLSVPSEFVRNARAADVRFAGTVQDPTGVRSGELSLARLGPPYASCWALATSTKPSFEPLSRSNRHTSTNARVNPHGRNAYAGAVVF
jgi:hypothetical protein